MTRIEWTVVVMWHMKGITGAPAVTYEGARHRHFENDSKMQWVPTKVVHDPTSRLSYERCMQCGKKAPPVDYIKKAHNRVKGFI